MTVQDAIDKLENLKKGVFNATDKQDKDYICREIGYVVDNLTYIGNDPILGGRDMQISDALANHITSVTQAILGNVNADWANKLSLLWSDFKQIRRESESKNLEAKGKLATECVDIVRRKRLKPLFITGIVLFVAVGIVAILLAILENHIEYLQNHHETVDTIISVCGLIDFMMGGIGFFVERLSDFKAGNVKSEIAKETQKGLEDIERSKSIEDMYKAKNSTINNIKNISIIYSDHHQCGLINIIKV